jgi:hypothetical protein
MAGRGMCFAILHRQRPHGWSTPREDGLPSRSARHDDMYRLAPVRSGKGIRASMAYVIDDLETLKDLRK